MFSLALLSLFVSEASAIPLSGAPSNALVISEIMHNPDVVVDNRGEYIENATFECSGAARSSAGTEAGCRREFPTES